MKKFFIIIGYILCTTACQIFEGVKPDEKELDYSATLDRVIGKYSLNNSDTVWVISYTITPYKISAQSFEFNLSFVGQDNKVYDKRGPYFKDSTQSTFVFPYQEKQNYDDRWVLYLKFKDSNGNTKTYDTWLHPR